MCQDNRQRNTLVERYREVSVNVVVWRAAYFFEVVDWDGGLTVLGVRVASENRVAQDVPRGGVGMLNDRWSDAVVTAGVQP